MALNTNPNRFTFVTRNVPLSPDKKDYSFKVVFLFPIVETKLINLSTTDLNKLGNEIIGCLVLDNNRLCRDSENECIFWDVNKRVVQCGTHDLEESTPFRIRLENSTEHTAVLSPSLRIQELSGWISNEPPVDRSTPENTIEDLPAEDAAETLPGTEMSQTELMDTMERANFEATITELNQKVKELENKNSDGGGCGLTLYKTDGSLTWPLVLMALAFLLMIRFKKSMKNFWILFGLLLLFPSYTVWADCPEPRRGELSGKLLSTDLNEYQVSVDGAIVTKLRITALPGCFTSSDVGISIHANDGCVGQSNCASPLKCILRNTDEVICPLYKQEDHKTLIQGDLEKFHIRVWDLQHILSYSLDTSPSMSVSQIQVFERRSSTGQCNRALHLQHDSDLQACKCMDGYDFIDTNDHSKGCRARAADLCADVTCADGETCDPADGECKSSDGGENPDVSNDELDHDGVPDDDDNCPGTANPVDPTTGLQTDTDGDGLGDECDQCPEQKAAMIISKGSMNAVFPGASSAAGQGTDTTEPPPPGCPANPGENPNPPSGDSGGEGPFCSLHQNGPLSSTVWLTIFSAVGILLTFRFRKQKG